MERSTLASAYHQPSTLSAIDHPYHHQLSHNSPIQSPSSPMISSSSAAAASTIISRNQNDVNNLQVDPVSMGFTRSSSSNYNRTIHSILTASSAPEHEPAQPVITQPQRARQERQWEQQHEANENNEQTNNIITSVPGRLTRTRAWARERTRARAIQVGRFLLSDVYLDDPERVNSQSQSQSQSQLQLQSHSQPEPEPEPELEPELEQEPEPDSESSRPHPNTTVQQYHDGRQQNDESATDQYYIPPPTPLIPDVRQNSFTVPYPPGISSSSTSTSTSSAYVPSYNPNLPSVNGSNSNNNTRNDHAPSSTQQPQTHHQVAVSTMESRHTSNENVSGGRLEPISSAGLIGRTRVSGRQISNHDMNDVIQTMQRMRVNINRINSSSTNPTPSPIPTTTTATATLSSASIPITANTNNFNTAHQVSVVNGHNTIIPPPPPCVSDNRAASTQQRPLRRQTNMMFSAAGASSSIATSNGLDSHGGQHHHRHNNVPVSVHLGSAPSHRPPLHHGNSHHHRRSFHVMTGERRSAFTSGSVTGLVLSDDPTQSLISSTTPMSTSTVGTTNTNIITNNGRIVNRSISSSALLSSSVQTINNSHFNVVSGDLNHHHHTNIRHRHRHSSSLSSSNSNSNGNDHDHDHHTNSNSHNQTNSNTFNTRRGLMTPGIPRSRVINFSQTRSITRTLQINETSPAQAHAHAHAHVHVHALEHAHPRPYPRPYPNVHAQLQPIESNSNIAMATAMDRPRRNADEVPPATARQLGQLPRLRMADIVDWKLDHDSDLLPGLEKDLCVICTDVFGTRNNLTVLPCRHVFHRGCVIPWLRIKRSCPMCRRELRDRADP